MMVLLRRLPAVVAAAALALLGSAGTGVGVGDLDRPLLPDLLQLDAAAVHGVDAAPTELPAAPVTAGPGPRPPPALIWCSTPVLPNETAIVQGSGFGTAPHVTVEPHSPSDDAVVVVPLQVTNNTVMFVIPAHFAATAFTVNISRSPTSPAGSIVIGAPEIWWAQGDPGGSSAVAGGSIRVFGRGLSIEADQRHAREGRTVDVQFAALAEQLRRAARQGNTAEMRRITEVQSRLLEQLEQRSRDDVPLKTTLLLTPVGGGPPLTLDALAANLSTVAAKFTVPSSATPGTYEVCLSNGAAQRCLDSFYSATAPAQTTIEIVSPSKAAWPTRHFAVDALCRHSVSNASTQINCTDAIRTQITAAGDAGGGVVVFGVGRYYVTAPLLLPHNVRLKGASMGKTALYFQFNNLVDVPQSFISNAANGTRYGVSDLDIYVLSFYVNLFNIGPHTDGVSIQRVRVRANAVFCQNMCGNGRIPPWSDQACGQDMDYYGKRGYSDCPKCDWPWRQQPIFALFGRNWEISDCDVWSTYNVFYGAPTVHFNKTDMATWRNHSNVIDSMFGLIRGNTVWNGGNCHWFDGNKQLIYEQNSCTGSSPMAGGSNIATYGGGDAHHLYLGGNTWHWTWGNDREVMTYDNRGSVYTGPIISLSADGRNITLRGGNFSQSDHDEHTGMKANAQLNFGKAVVLSNGTGAGQYRRVVDWDWDISPNGVSSWVLDKPFTELDLAENVQVEITTFRGNNIFHNNHYADTGVFQYYGTGMNNMVYGMTTERQDGIVANGQRALFKDWATDKNYHSGVQPNYCAWPTDPSCLGRVCCATH